MRPHGFTLYELIITLAIVTTLITLGIPSFNKQINLTRTKTATLALLEAIETTRSTAVFRNTRMTLLVTDSRWEQGWILFCDTNNNAVHDTDEEILIRQEALQGVISKAKSPMDTYVSFVGTGEGKKASSGSEGAFLAGTIQICPEQKGDGYALVLSKGGRTRVEKVKAADCIAARK